MAMFRRPRPGGGRHPPPLAPTVSNFKPRAQWNNSGSSMFLYVNLPGFYMDQIEIKKDEKTRTVQIQGQRPLSTQTKARFNESYRVPDSCDMTKSNISFSHGLLTIEFQAVVEGEKSEKAIQDQGKIVQRHNQDENIRPGLNGSSMGQKKPSDKEKLVETSQGKASPMANEEEPKTYKSAVEGKRAVPTSSREKSEQKVKENVVERKEAVQLGQQKTAQKLKEEVGGSLKHTVHAKEEKVTERKKDADIGQDNTGQKVKEEGLTRTPTIGGSLEPKVYAKEEKLVESKGNGEIGQKLKEEGKTELGQKKQEKHTKPGFGDDARKTEKKIAAEAEPKTKESVEKIARDVNGNVKSNQDEKIVGDKVSEGEIQETVKQKKIEETGLAKETGDMKDNAEVTEPKKEDSDDPMKQESTRGSEDREKIVEKSLESETSPLLVEKGQNKTDMDLPAVIGTRMDEEENQKYDLSLVNVGAAALVIMGFGAYVCVPLVKLFY